MNVIFLDIDGVMNHNFHMIRSTLHSSFEFCPKATEHLKEILTTTDSKIVLSSTWRIGETVKSLKEELFCHYDLEDFVVGLTPFSGKYNEQRGLEIQRYIDTVENTERHVDKFVIIDDDKDMAHLMDRLVYVNRICGLSSVEKKNEAIKLMTHK
jgi:hypothetical protein